MKFDIITIFPDIIESYFSKSVIGRAQQQRLVKITAHDLRHYTTDKRKTVDDKPYGGGPGMIMQITPIYQALKKIRNPKLKSRTILLTPRGKTFTQQDAKRLKKYDQLIFVCGRYEGFDERVNNFVDEKISLGKFVLAGGEIPAMAITESIVRLIDGVLGKKESLDEESFSRNENYLEYPQYSRPEVFTYYDTKIKSQKNSKVPPDLLNGNHQKIKKWKEKHAKSG